MLSNLSDNLTAGETAPFAGPDDRKWSRQTEKAEPPLPGAAPPRSWVPFIVVFIIAAMLAGATVIYSEHLRRELLRADIAATGANHAHMLKDSLEHSLSATYALAALVRQGQGSVRHFDALGREMLQLFPGAANLQLAPDGVTRQVVPLAGNEKVLGLDQLHDPIRAKESILAKETGKLTLAGPFPLVQGGLGLVGRMPVFLADNPGQRHFWGFTVALLRLPESLDSANLDTLGKRGIVYKLWRTHPDTGKPQIIDESTAGPVVDPVTHTIRIANVEWVLSLAPSHGWGSPVSVAVKSLCGLLVSLVSAYLAHLIAVQQRHKAELERLVYARTRELRTSEMRYRALFEQSGDYIFVLEVGRDGVPVIVDVNYAAIQAHGYAREEILGKPISFLDPDSTSEDHRKRIAALNSSAISLFTVRHRRKDGTLFDVEVKAQTLKLGQKHLIVTAERDITDRKQAEASLRESEAYLNSILNNLADMVFVKDADHRWVLANDKFCELTGLGRTELIGKSDYDFFPKEEADVFWKMDDAVLHSGEENFSEERLTNAATGVTVILNTKKTLYISNKGEKFIVGVGRDITEFRKLQKTLQQVQKMESIGTLAGGIAHDFNNILFPIIGMSELLMDDLPPDSLQYENAMEILKAGQRGGDLVKQILAFSRQKETRKIPIRIQQLLKEVLKLSRATIPADIDITQNIRPDCGAVEADPTQVHQIAMNLITNAYHAVEPGGGKIMIQLSETELKPDDLPGGLLEPDRYAVLTVSDTGCGTDPAVKDKIFEPYFTTKEQGKGTGLGLAVVYGIVKAHKGEITVSSDVGKGTTFTVYLPVVQKPAESFRMETSGGEPTGTERILLVDDEEPIARLLGQSLERLGYRVTLKTGSTDALEAFYANPSGFDLVITDMAMPIMTGEELARKIMKIRPGIPVIICTGFSERINPEIAGASGIRGFLMKPTVRSELVRMVRKLLDEGEKQSFSLTKTAEP